MVAEEAELVEAAKSEDLTPIELPGVELPKCEVHTFVFLGSAREKEKIKGENRALQWKRTDTFYCQHCLSYTYMTRQQEGEKIPYWFRKE